MRYAVPRTIRTPEQLEEVVEHYSGLDEFVFDVETVGKRRGHPKTNRVSWLGLAAPGCRADVIPLGHPQGEVIVQGYKQREPWWDEENPTPTGRPRKKWRVVHYPSTFTDPPDQLWTSDVFDALKPIFFSEARKIGHGVKFDLASVSKYYGGAIIPPPYGDTLIAAHLLNSSLKYGLKAIVTRLYEHTYDTEDIAKPDKNGENGIEIHAFSKAARYTGLDVRYTWMLWEQFYSLLRKSKMEKLFDLEMDVLEVLLSMEDAGVRIDTKAMVKLGVELRERMVEIEKSVFAAAGHTFDMNSSPQKAKFIYETRGHEVFAWTKGGQDGKNKKPSTAAAVLETYAAKDEAVADLLDYTAVQKLYSTYVGEQLDDGSYVGGLLEHLIDGRLHADFVQYGTDTGRFSCRSPNLQNIPKRAKDERSQLIRKMFIPNEGESFIVADYGQIEYRVLAHYSEDPTLVEAFVNGYDPHAATAAILFDKHIDDVLPAERDTAKNFNFAEVYGAGLGKLAGMAKVSFDQVKKLKSTYNRQFPRVQDFKKEVIKTARNRKPPYVTTMLGRRRYLPGLWSNDDDKRYGAERQAVNTVVQGTAADIIKIAMVELHHALELEFNGQAKILIQVHDELVVTAPDEIAEPVQNVMQETMEGVNILTVPLEAEANVGKSWSAAK